MEEGFWVEVWTGALWRTAGFVYSTIEGAKAFRDGVGALWGECRIIDNRGEVVG